MSGPVTIEERARRVDAALAEIGYPVGTVRVVHGGLGVPRGTVDTSHVWKATQIAGPPISGSWTCRACAVAACDLPTARACEAAWSRCEAFQRLTEDCGIDRSPSPLKGEQKNG